MLNRYRLVLILIQYVFLNIYNVLKMIRKNTLWMVMLTDPFLHVKILIFENTHLSIQSNNCYIFTVNGKKSRL